MNISNEIGKIGEKAVKDWLIKNDYRYQRLYNDPLYSYQDNRDYIPTPDNGVKLDYIVKYSEKFPWLTKREIMDIRLFLEASEEFEYKEGQHRDYRGFHHAEKYPDYLAKIPYLAFVEVKVNDSKLRPNQRTFMRYAEKLSGINAVVLRVKVRVSIEGISQESI